MARLLCPRADLPLRQRGARSWPEKRRPPRGDDAFFDEQGLWDGDLPLYLQHEAYRGQGRFKFSMDHQPYRWQGIARKHGEGREAWLQRECEHNLRIFGKKPHCAFIKIPYDVLKARGQSFAREVRLVRRDHHIVVYGNHRNKLILQGSLKGHDLSWDHMSQMRSAVYARFLSAHARKRFLGELKGALDAMIRHDASAEMVDGFKRYAYLDKDGSTYYEVQGDPFAWVSHHVDRNMQSEIQHLCNDLWPPVREEVDGESQDVGRTMAMPIVRELGDAEVRAWMGQMRRHIPKNQLTDVWNERSAQNDKRARDWVLQHTAHAHIASAGWPDMEKMQVELNEWVCLMIRVRRIFVVVSLARPKQRPSETASMRKAARAVRRGLPGAPGNH